MKTATPTKNSKNDLDSQFILIMLGILGAF